MISKLKKIIAKQNFNPGFLGLFINPFFFARRGLYEKISAIADNITGKTLDVGCGIKPYEKLYGSSEYIGMDVQQEGHSHENENIDVFYDGKIFPFKDGEFDSVVTNETLEHVFNPEQFLQEICRVLRKNGKLLITVPFVWDEHEQPYDCARYSSWGLKYMLEDNGFEIISQAKSVDDLSLIVQLFNEYIYKKTKMFRKNHYVDMLLTIILIAPFNFLGLLLLYIFPKNEDLYLDNIVLARKKTNV